MTKRTDSATPSADRPALTSGVKGEDAPGQPGLSQDEIEITPEMIEAGVETMNLWADPFDELTSRLPAEYLESSVRRNPSDFSRILASAPDSAHSL